MSTINYILINETRSKLAVRSITGSRVSDFAHHCIVVEAGDNWQVAGSKSRTVLIDKLLELRRHNPEAKILGVSEIDGRCIHPSDAMNELRYELSNCP